MVKGHRHSGMFKKGVSPNPGGVATRPETIARRKVIQDVREYCKQHSQAAVEALVDVMNTKNAPPSARVAAANAILDRSFGKPQVEINATVSAYDKMSERELIEYIAGKTIEGQAVRVIEEMEQEERELLESDEE